MHQCHVVHIPPVERYAPLLRNQVVERTQEEIPRHLARQVADGQPVHPVRME